METRNTQYRKLLQRGYEKFSQQSSSLNLDDLILNFSAHDMLEAKLSSKLTADQLDFLLKYKKLLRLIFTKKKDFDFEIDCPGLSNSSYAKFIKKLKKNNLDKLTQADEDEVILLQQETFSQLKIIAEFPHGQEDISEIFLPRSIGSFTQNFINSFDSHSNLTIILINAENDEDLLTPDLFNDHYFKEVPTLFILGKDLSRILSSTNIHDHLAKYLVIEASTLRSQNSLSWAEEINYITNTLFNYLRHHPLNLQSNLFFKLSKSSIAHVEVLTKEIEKLEEKTKSRHLGFNDIFALSPVSGEINNNPEELIAQKNVTHLRT